MSYFLCGQTGNNNRGCEAIVRSTVSLLGGKSGDVFLATSDYATDNPCAKELGINLLRYKNYKTPVQRALGLIKGKLFPNSLGGQKYIQSEIIDLLEKGDTVINIGGDIYCYNTPRKELAINRYCKNNGIKSVLWCCSIEEESITKEIKKDLNRYDFIFARERLTYNNLISSGLDKEKIIKVCDSAFYLDIKPIELPKIFEKNNTVGINVSDFFSGKNGIGIKSVCNLIEFILTDTDMDICLIPHVYDEKTCSGDLKILKDIFEKYKCERISLIDKDLTAEELKFAISRLRLFVGARTHATIAAYSTGVPTICLGYSVKSRGIAEDLFGTSENYVVSVSELNSGDEVINAFKFILKHEKEIKDRLLKILPEYKKSILDAVNKYIVKNGELKKPFEICKSGICTGCFACEKICPVGAIKKAQKNGFFYPEIDFNKCVLCGKCKNICPALNKAKDDKEFFPKTYCAFNKDENIINQSSSGGVFPALAKSVLSGGGVVFGAAFNKDFTLCHTAAKTEEELKKFSGSKYLQSDKKEVFIEIENLLKSGKKVLFCGTPCEVGGLKAYLVHEYENLFTVDFICHGVPSPEVFKKYLKSLFEKYGKIEEVSFRKKIPSLGNQNFNATFESGKEITERANENPFYLAFLSDLILRESCYNCSFKLKKRQSDITAADFWGADKVLGVSGIEKGYSLVLINSKKGEKLFKSSEDKLQILSVDHAAAIKDNPSYHSSVNKPAFFKAFNKTLNKKGLDRAVKKYCGNSIFAKIRRAKYKII